jgi:hypothetical protein
MMRRFSPARPVRFAAVALVAALAFAGCAKKEEPAPAPVAETPKAVPFRVVSMDLGKQLDADKRVVQSSARFGVRDTIHLSVASEGTAPSVTLRAIWKYEDGQTVADDAQSLMPSGPAQTEFHIIKSSPWPTGKYTVELFADTTSAGRKEFQVQ